VLLLDKPLGVTSNAALQQVKSLFRARKAGHTGSLDPLATGLLPVCMGDATKISAYLLDADKRYRVRAQLGVTTSTGDAEGDVLERREVGELSNAHVEEVLAEFRGEIEQIPPMYSALKWQGKRLYDLAREGIEVERAPRRVKIHSLTLLERGVDTLDFDVHCSKGTYVRTLAEDIGAALGCGSHVSALRRTEVGPYAVQGSVTIEVLETRVEQGGAQALDEFLRPVESALSEWPKVRLSEDAAYYLRLGQAVIVPRAPTTGWVRLYADDARFLGVGQILEDGRVAPRRLVGSR
jgi:tRNA pseudouridine55 synthase